MKRISFLFMSLPFLLTSCSLINAIEEDVASSDSVIYIPLEQIKTAKDETVYVKLDEDGKVSTINVVNRLENVSNGFYYDYGDYKGVINLTSKDKLTINDDKITVPIIGSYESFYYQTTLNDSYQLPYIISVDFYLDGYKVLAKDVVGRKGIFDVDINIQSNQLSADYFRNNYMCQLQIPINIDKNQLIDYSGATKVLVGKTATLAYMVMPSQSASYRLSFNSNAFEWGGLTATYSFFDINSLLGFDLATIPAYIEQLKDGLIAMKDGQIALKDGIVLLVDGLNQISGGLNQYSEGNNLFNEEMKQYLDGIVEINDNLQLLNQGLQQLATSGDNITSGFEQLHSGILQLITNIEPLVAYIITVRDQLNQLKEGLTQFEVGLNQYVNGVNEIASNLNLLAQGLNVIALNTTSIKEGLDEMSEGSEDLATALTQVASSSALIPNHIQELINGQQQIIDGLSNAGELIDALPINNIQSEVVSFTSSMNIKPKSVQFVIKQDALTIGVIN